MCFLFVNLLGQSSNSLLEDLQRLNPLKDIENKIDTALLKKDKPVTVQVPKPQKGVKQKR